MQACESFRGIAATDFKDGRGIIRLRCKQWSCEYCAKENQSMWRNHLLKTMTPLSDHWTMLTVTCMGQDHRDMVTLKRLMQNFDRLMKRLQRAYKRFEYVRVYEQHKSGEFHMHVLCGFECQSTIDEWCYDDQGREKYVGKHYQDMLAHVMACELGEIFDCKPIVDNSGTSQSSVYAVRYISKYLTKAVGATMPKGTRRIQTSQKIGSPKITSSLEWTMKSGVFIDDIETQNWYDMQKQGAKITYDDFVKSHVYPAELDN